MSDNVDFMSSSICSILRIYSGIFVLVLFICKQLLENELWVERMTEQGQVSARAHFTRCRCWESIWTTCNPSSPEAEGKGIPTIIWIARHAKCMNPWFN